MMKDVIKCRFKLKFPRFQCAYLCIILVLLLFDGILSLEFQLFGLSEPFP